MAARRVSFSLGVILWLVCSSGLLLITFRMFQGSTAEIPLVGTLLVGTSRAEQLPPVAILLVFGWVLFELSLHFVRLRNEGNVTQQFEAAVDGMDERVTPASFGRIGGKGRSTERAKVVVENSHSPEALREALPAASALDASAMENQYVLLKVYTWILPVIGFIGTAWGMSHAISGFSEALKPTNIDIAALTARLSQFVIPGLANAFGTTILALSSALVAHFCISAVQAWDERVLDRLDRASVRLLAKLPTTRSAGGSSGMSVNLDQIVKQLTAAATQLQQAAQALGTAGKELMTSLDRPYHVTVTRGERR